MTQTKNATSPKDVIKAYLNKRAAEDPQFAANYAKAGKNIDECFRYIMGEARKRGNAVCMTDDEVFGLAVHYYDEDNIKVAPAPRASVATSKAPAPAVELTEDEKEKARRQAIAQYQRECILEQEKKEARRRKQEAERREAIRKKQPYSPSLFDFD